MVEIDGFIFQEYEYPLVDTEVLAKWRDGYFYRGKVSSIPNESKCIMIKWNDGYTPTLVSQSDIILYEQLEHEKKQFTISPKDKWDSHMVNCKICGKEFKKNGLWRHMIVHNRTPNCHWKRNLADNNETLVVKPTDTNSTVVISSIKPSNLEIRIKLPTFIIYSNDDLQLDVFQRISVIGMLVIAKWKDGNFYSGKIQECINGVKCQVSNKYLIKFNMSGDLLWVKHDDIIVSKPLESVQKPESKITKLSYSPINNINILPKSYELERNQLPPKKRYKPN